LIQQSLRIIAIGLVKLPRSAEIHTCRGRRCELLGRARRQKNYGQSKRSSHGVSLFNDDNADIAAPQLAIASRQYPTLRRRSYMTVSYPCALQTCVTAI
jgi:hypothetical protein